MEKLIQLLNEHLKTFDTETNKTLKVFAFEEATKSFLAKNGVSYRQERVISKRFGFIKRLVDNDKIERLAFAESGLLGKYTDFELSYDTPREDYTNMLLMELSIQDNPIEYLISVLR